MTPGELIQAREVLDLTLREMGERLGISKDEVWRKEAEQRPITVVQSVAVLGLLLGAAVRELTEHNPDALIKRLLASL